jgi:hypothetical protein
VRLNCQVLTVLYHTYFGGRHASRPRLTSTLSSINPLIPILSGRRTSSQCLPVGPLPGKWTCGCTMKMTRTSQKVSAHSCICLFPERPNQCSIDATELDVWSLDHLKALLKNATDNSSLNEELRQEKVVFFLHLLGLDTTGHSYRPFSKVCIPALFSLYMT